MDYLQELQDMGVDDDRIAEAAENKTLPELYDQIMWECSEQQFRVDGHGGWFCCGACGAMTCTDNPTGRLCLCGSTDEPVWYPSNPIEAARAEGDDMLNPTYNIFGVWED